MGGRREAREAEESQSEMRLTPLTGRTAGLLVICQHFPDVYWMHLAFCPIQFHPLGYNWPFLSALDLTFIFQLKSSLRRLFFGVIFFSTTLQMRLYSYFFNFVTLFYTGPKI